MYYSLFITRNALWKVHNVLHHQLLVFLRMSRITIFHYMFIINATLLLRCIIVVKQKVSHLHPVAFE